MWRKYGDRVELHVQDYASGALRWLRQVIPAERIHETGGCQTQNQHYDVIYLSAVDYALPDDELIVLLSELSDCLRVEGKVMIISASFQEKSLGQVFVRSIKMPVKLLLERFGLYTKGQFWGWTRTRADYQGIMSAAGFSSVTDGFIETPHQRTYWIMGNGMLKE